jgi:ABC-type Fe3+/spermidine/putrescine transport system ATPase subunit
MPSSGPSGVRPKTTLCSVSLLDWEKSRCRAKIHLGDEDITVVPIHDDVFRLTLLFQKLRLFSPTSMFLTNIAYSLRLKKTSGTIVFEQKEFLKILERFTLKTTSINSSQPVFFWRTSKQPCGSCSCDRERAAMSSFLDEPSGCS